MPKQRQVKVDWNELLCFEIPTEQLKLAKWDEKRHKDDLYSLDNGQDRFSSHLASLS